MLSNLIHMITAAVAAHPAIAGWLATSLVAIYRTRTPAQWIALGESNARLQGLFKFARGGGFDPARALEGLVQIFTGKRAPNPLELVIASQAARIAELELSLAGYQRRTADAAEHDLSRPTLAPPAPPPLRAATLTGVGGDDALHASARRFVAQELGEAFDASARQEIPADAVAEARRITGTAHPAQMFTPEFAGTPDPKEPT